MRIVNLGGASYAKFTNVLNALGTQVTLFYFQNGGFVLDVHVLFEDEDVALNATLSSVATTTFTTDFPVAIEAVVTIS